MTVKGNGKGGRNQELALAFLNLLETRLELKDRIFLLSAATDGNDGPTEAAGAYVTPDLVCLTKREKLSSQRFLSNNDAFTFFNRIGGLLITGPSNTNVCDIQIIIVLP